MFNFRFYPLVKFRRTISTRLALLILTSVFVSIVLICLYFYSHDHYQKEHLPIRELILKNGTKIFLNHHDFSSSSDLNSGWLKNVEKSFSASANFGLIHAFVASISVIIVSELGDKTFFIAAIMAMRHSRLTIYLGAMGALAAMTILSAVLGNVVTKFVPRIYTYYLSSLLFAAFGVKMLRDGYFMSPDEAEEEFQEAQHEVEKAEANEDLETGTNLHQRAPRLKSTGAKLTNVFRRYVSPIFIQAFIMTFLAEWGDRSQITTIVLAASENLLGVIIGGIFGHGLCTGLAVIGGRFIAQRISPKTVTFIGGIVFLCFAISAFFIRPDH